MLAKRLTVTIGWDGDILDDALKTADFMINSTPPRNDLGARAPNLRWLHTTGAGIDGLMPLDWLPPEVTLTNNSGQHRAKAEDSCTLLLLALHARLPDMLVNQRKHAWNQILTHPIAGLTTLVVGFGDLGQAAGRAARKLGMRVVAVTRTGKSSRLADQVVPVARIDRLLPKADFVIVTTPLTTSTRGLLDERRLGLMKPGAALVNIARAPVVDYDALCRKLESGALRGAALDVFDEEPLPAESPLWETKNLMVLPHITCDGPDYIDGVLDRWFANFERLLKGRRLHNIVDRKLGY